MPVEFYYYHHSDNVGYMKEPLERFREKVGDIDTMLDIGAAHGHFSRQFLDIWPEAQITAIECNQLDSYYLDKEEDWDVRFACLGDKPCKKTFYLSEADQVGGGSSFYLEDTPAFDKRVEQELDIVTLDSLNLKPHRFIKMDTQGSEVDIIKGGKKTIEQADFLLIEMSLLEYNKGGCLIDDVMAETRDMGFRLLQTFGPVHGGHFYNNQQVQIDGLFAKEHLPVFSVV